MTQTAELLTQLRLDSSQFNQGIKTAEAQVMGFSKKSSNAMSLLKVGFAGLAGGFAITGLVSSLSAAFDKAADLSDKLAKLNIEPEGYQTLAYAANQAGIENEMLDQSLAKMTTSIGKAQGGSKELGAAFKALGIPLDDLARMDPAQQFELIGQKLGQIPDRTVQAALGVQIFGKSATQNLGFFNSDMKGAIANAKNLGVALSKDKLDGLDQLKEKFEDSFAALKTSGLSIIAEFAKPITTLLDGIGLALSKLKDGAAEVVRGIKAGVDEIGNSKFFKSQSSGVAKFLEGHLKSMQKLGVLPPDALAGKQQQQNIGPVLESVIPSINGLKSQMDYLASSAKGAAKQLGAIDQLRVDRAKKESDRILETAFNKSAKPLAKSEEFESILSELIADPGSVRDRKSSFTKDGVTKFSRMIPDPRLGRLEEIVKDQGQDKSVDVSPLTTALAELKNFLQGKTNTPPVQVALKIKVEPTTGLKTIIMGDPEFQQKLREQVKITFSEAARGEI